MSTIMQREICNVLSCIQSSLGLLYPNGTSILGSQYQGGVHNIQYANSLAVGCPASDENENSACWSPIRRTFWRWCKILSASIAADCWSSETVLYDTVKQWIRLFTDHGEYTQTWKSWVPVHQMQPPSKVCWCLLFNTWCVLQGIVNRQGLTLLIGQFWNCSCQMSAIKFCFGYKLWIL